MRGIPGITDVRIALIARLFCVGWRGGDMNETKEDQEVESVVPTQSYIFEEHRIDFFNYSIGVIILKYPHFVANQIIFMILLGE